MAAVVGKNRDRTSAGIWEPSMETTAMRKPFSLPHSASSDSIRAPNTGRPSQGSVGPTDSRPASSTLQQQRWSDVNGANGNQRGDISASQRGGAGSVGGGQRSDSGTWNGSGDRQDGGIYPPSEAASWMGAPSPPHVISTPNSHQQHSPEFSSQYAAHAPPHMNGFQQSPSDRPDAWQGGRDASQTWGSGPDARGQGGSAHPRSPPVGQWGPPNDASSRGGQQQQVVHSDSGPVPMLSRPNDSPPHHHQLKSSPPPPHQAQGWGANVAPRMESALPNLQQGGRWDNTNGTNGSANGSMGGGVMVPVSGNMLVPYEGPGTGGDVNNRKQQSDVQGLKQTVQALQAQMQAMHATMQAMQAQMQQMQLQAEGSGKSESQTQTMQQMQQTGQQLKDRLQEGLSDLADLIGHKDAQQRARLFNSTSIRDRDPLEALPNERGELPDKFPSIRREVTYMAPDLLSFLLDFYGLPRDPKETRLERLSRHIGLRLG